MKVALFTDSNVFAGTERHIAALGAALRDESVNVSIACPTPSPLADRAAEARLPVIAIQKSGMVDRQAIKRLITGLRTGEFDVVHAHNGRTALSAAIAVRLAGRGHAVLTQHFLRPNHTNKTGPVGLLFNLAHAWVNRRLAHVIAISSAVADASLARGDVTPDRITKIPNGLPDVRLQSLTPSEDVRRELSVPQDCVLVICVARLDPEKNVGSLVTAMADLVRRDPASKLRCVIAGTGIESASLVRQIHQAGLQGVVTLLGHRDDALSLIRAADILVLPSIAEPFGLVLLEAMAVGTPVIATRVGGPMEIVEDGVTGLLVAPRDPASLANAIERLADDSTLRLSMSRAGRQRFTDHYTAQEMARKTAFLYRQLNLNVGRASARHHPSAAY